MDSLIWGQAVYLRDAVGEIKDEPGHRIDWRESNILKLASFMELIRLNDCAIELIQCANDRGLLRHQNSDELIDLLVPVKKGKSFSYQEFLQGLRRAQREAARTGSKSQKEPAEASHSWASTANRQTLIGKLPRPH